jgi:hypothetical protein
MPSPAAANRRETPPFDLTHPPNPIDDTPHRRCSPLLARVEIKYLLIPLCALSEKFMPSKNTLLQPSPRQRRHDGMMSIPPHLPNDRGRDRAFHSQPPPIAPCNDNSVDDASPPTTPLSPPFLPPRVDVIHDTSHDNCPTTLARRFSTCRQCKIMP